MTMELTPWLASLGSNSQEFDERKNIFIIAPSGERSGVGHCVSYNAPTQIERISENRYSVSDIPPIA